jgi:phosphatidate cytidylyltransferase
MLRMRILSGIVLVPLVVGVVVAGGWPYIGLVLVVFSIAAIEFVHMVARKGHRASGGLMLLWVWLLVAGWGTPDTGLIAPGVTLLLLATLGWSLIRYRQGTPNSFTGFGLTLGSGLYIGWAAGHFVALRALPDGLWWTALVLPSVWLADSIAYAAGLSIGHNHIMPDVSPKKTWEGYLIGIVGAALGTAGLALAWRALGAGRPVTAGHGLMIGLLSSVIGPLGDFGISMFKRQVGVKDTSRIIPGHGGLLDRADALMVAVMVDYYYVKFIAL